MKTSTIRAFTILSFVVAASSLAGLSLQSACTTGEKAAAKTALDVAGDACRFEFGAAPTELPPGVTLEDFCKAEEHLQPFVDHLLSAREGLARKLGTAPARDAGTD